MKFSVELKNENALNFLRRLGYAPEGTDQKTGEFRFAKPLRGARYPRFHLYVTVPAESKTITLSLHLDQKQPSYEGNSRPALLGEARPKYWAAAHSGEYAGTLVETEAKRILSAADSPRSSFGEAGQ